MIRSNFHVHSDYCDGKNTMEEMTQAAIQSGLEVIGFASHNPIPQEDWTMAPERLEEYLAEIKSLQEKYKDQIHIYKGLEVDYFKDEGFNPFIEEYMDRLDYWIGSVHGLKKWEDGRYWFIDESVSNFQEGINHFFNGDAKKAVTCYYEQLMEMVETGRPDIVGHMDLVKKNNGGSWLFDETEKWYKDLVDAFLSVAKRMDAVIEINTGGVCRFGPECFYPSPWILDKMHDLDVGWTLNGDSHDVNGIDYYYREAEQLLKEKGMDSYWTMESGKWIQKKF